MTDTRKNKPDKHQTLESVFTRHFTARPGEIFSVIGLQTVTTLPVLSNNMAKGSIGVLFFHKKREFDTFQTYIQEFGYRTKFKIWLVDPLHPTIRWKPEQIGHIYQLDVQGLMEEPVYILSYYLKLLKQGGSLTLFLEYSPKTDLVLRRLLHEAEMGEMIGLLEKVGFMSQFQIRSIRFDEQLFYSLKATKGFLSKE